MKIRRAIARFLRHWLRLPAGVVYRLTGVLFITAKATARATFDTGKVDIRYD